VLEGIEKTSTAATMFPQGARRPAVRLEKFIPKDAGKFCIQVQRLKLIVMEISAALLPSAKWQKSYNMPMRRRQTSRASGVPSNDLVLPASFHPSFVAGVAILPSANEKARGVRA
jgi:hypothetical protein